MKTLISLMLLVCCTLLEPNSYAATDNKLALSEAFNTAHLIHQQDIFSDVNADQKSLLDKTMVSIGCCGDKGQFMLYARPHAAPVCLNKPCH